MAFCCNDFQLFSIVSLIFAKFPRRLLKPRANVLKLLNSPVSDGNATPVGTVAFGDVDAHAALFGDFLFECEEVDAFLPCSFCDFGAVFCVVGLVLFDVVFRLSNVKSEGDDLFGKRLHVFLADKRPAVPGSEGSFCNVLPDVRREFEKPDEIGDVQA